MSAFTQKSIRLTRVALLSSVVFAGIQLISCLNTYSDDSSHRILFGITGGLAGAGAAADTANQVVSCTATSDIVVSETNVELDEGGDVARTWQAADPGFSDSDDDNTGFNAGGPWGNYTWEVCIHLPTAFNGTVEIPITQNTTYTSTGRLTIQKSFPLAEAGNPMPTALSFTGDGSTGHGTASRQCFTFARSGGAPPASGDAIRNDVEEAHVVTLGTITTDDSGVYIGQDPCDISVNIEDDESPGVRVSNISRVMQEPGTGGNNDGTFSVRLRTTPTASVSMGVNATFDAVNVGNREGTIDKTSLTFTDTTAQTVTVTSVDDLEIDGLKSYVIDVETTSSSDSEYNGLEPRNVVIYNEDQSVPGYSYTITHNATSDVTGTGGGTITGFAVDQMNNMGSTYATFDISLRSKPTNDVVLTFANSRTDIADLKTPSLTFTPSNWNVAQTVTVEGKSNGTDFGTGNGNEDLTISFTAASTDTTYNNGGLVTEPSFTVRSCDNDNTHLIQPCNFSGASHGDSRSRFSSQEPSGTSPIWLISKNNPGGTATVGTTSTDTTEGTVPASVTIDSSNYNTLNGAGTNRIAISHADDGDLDGSVNFTITTAAATGTLTYDAYDILAATTDNELQYYVYQTGNTQEGTATTASISVCLGAQNSGGTVVIDVACATPADECGTLSASSLTFPMNSQSSATSNATCNGDGNAQTFTVNGLDDTFADGSQNFTVNLTLNTGTSTDNSGNFNSGSPANQSITNLDNEPAGKAIFVSKVAVATGGEMTAAGVLGADSNCNNNTYKPSFAPSGTYKALLAGIGETNTRLATTNGTDATGQADWVLTAGNYYYRCESGSCSDEVGHLFIADSNALFNPNGMSRDFSSTGYSYWTGLSETNLVMATQSSTPGAILDDPVNRHNCAGFTYNTAPNSPNPAYFGETWTDTGGGTVSQASNVDCSTGTLRLICVQQ